MKAPTGRKASVIVRVKATSLSERPKSAAIAVRHITTRKKSNASRVQPRKPATTVARVSLRVSIRPCSVCETGDKVTGITPRRVVPMDCPCLSPSISWTLHDGNPGDLRELYGGPLRGRAARARGGILPRPPPLGQGQCGDDRPHDLD